MKGSSWVKAKVQAYTPGTRGDHGRATILYRSGDKSGQTETLNVRRDLKLPVNENLDIELMSFAGEPLISGFRQEVARS